MSVVSKTSWRKLTIASVLAGIMYNSWPLGYWLNPPVVRHGLASDLEGVGQPYNWLFKYGDVTSSLIMLAVCWLLWHYVKKAGHRRQVRMTLLGLAVFCAGTALAALSSETCVAALRHCPAFTHSFVSLTHSITSVAAGLGLFVSLASLWQQRPNRWLTAQIIVFVALGIWTLLTLFVPAGVLVQNIFISYCALCLAVYPWCFRYVYEP